MVLDVDQAKKELSKDCFKLVIDGKDYYDTYELVSRAFRNKNADNDSEDDYDYDYEM